MVKTQVDGYLDSQELYDYEGLQFYIIFLVDFLWD
jgi:hypothetical protein